MTDINHIALAKALGARVSLVARPRFGFFAATKTIALADRLKPDNREPVLPAEDRAISQSFEEVRRGLAPDVVLATPVLKKKFLASCRHRGVEASNTAISKRLLAYRKSKQLGVTLSETTAESDANPHPYLHAAEIAFVQTSYRFDCSIDDLLVDDVVAAYFIELSEKIQPGGRHVDYITAALYIRKTRYLKKKEKEMFQRIESSSIEPRLRLITTLDLFKSEQIPEGEGVFLFAEKVAKNRTLYIGSGENLREAVSPFADLGAFRAVANHFWNPQPQNILLRIALLHNFEGVPTHTWELKMIHDKDPLFNFPVNLKDAA